MAHAIDEKPMRIISFKCTEILKMQKSLAPISYVIAFPCVWHSAWTPIQNGTMENEFINKKRKKNWKMGENDDELVCMWHTN